MKDVRSRGVSSEDIFRTRRGSSGVDVRTFFAQKSLDFLKFMMCPHGEGGKGSIFYDFVRMSLIDGSLVKKFK